MRKFMSRAIVTLVIGAMLTGNASAVSAKELYDARHVCTDVEAGGLDAAVQDAVKQKVISHFMVTVHVTKYFFFHQLL